MTKGAEQDYAVRIQYTDGTYYPDVEMEKLDWFTRAAAERLAGIAYNSALSFSDRMAAVEIIDADYTVVQREEIPQAA